MVEDTLWPATRRSEMAIERLKTHAHPFPYEHPCYEGAGHRLPYSAPVLTKMGPWTAGGSLEANGFADYDSWTRILDFLDKHPK